MSLVPGAQLGSYTIISLLGEGGMGVVWKARDTRESSFSTLALPSNPVSDSRNQTPH